MSASERRSAFLVEPRRFLLLAMLPIGDTMLVTPTILALRRRYPRAYIAALTSPVSAPILRNLGLLNRVDVIDARQVRTNTLDTIKMIYRLRRQRFDVCINFTSPAYKVITFFCNIPIRTYMKFPPWWWILPWGHGEWRQTHAARHYYDCARELNLPAWEEVDHVPIVKVPESDREQADGFLQQQLGGRASGPLVGMHAGGAGLDGRKRWPAERFARLANKLHSHFGARVVLLGGPDERDLAEEIARTCDCYPIIAVGSLSLMKSMAIIARCDLFVGNDSSLLHGAAALGIPYVGVFGATYAPNFHPIARDPGQGVLVEPDFPCGKPQYFVGGSPIWYRPHDDETCGELAAIPVDKVYLEASKLLEQPKGFP